MQSDDVKSFAVHCLLDGTNRDCGKLRFVARVELPFVYSLSQQNPIKVQFRESNSCEPHVPIRPGTRNLSRSLAPNVKKD